MEPALVDGEGGVEPSCLFVGRDGFGFGPRVRYEVGDCGGFVVFGVGSFGDTFVDAVPDGLEDVGFAVFFDESVGGGCRVERVFYLLIGEVSGCEEPAGVDAEPEGDAVPVTFGGLGDGVGHAVETFDSVAVGHRLRRGHRFGDVELDRVGAGAVEHPCRGVFEIVEPAAVHPVIGAAVGVDGWWCGDEFAFGEESELGSEFCGGRHVVAVGDAVASVASPPRFGDGGGFYVAAVLFNELLERGLALGAVHVDDDEV